MTKSLLDFPLYNKGVSAALSEKEESDERATCAFKNPPPSNLLLALGLWPLAFFFALIRRPSLSKPRRFALAFGSGHWLSVLYLIFLFNLIICFT